MIISLMVQRLDGDGETGTYHYEFDQDEVLVGRDGAVDVRLPHPAVSLVHLRLVRKQGRVWAIDGDSTNGTYLQSDGAGRRLEPRRGHALGEGSRLRLGPFELVIGPAPQVARSLTGATDTARFARQMVLEIMGGSATAQAKPRLDVLGGPQGGDRLPLPALAGPQVVGRGEDCALRLSDADCSRHHFEAQNKGQMVELRDLGSKNGVELNGERVEGVVVLSHGDELRAGRTRLRFVDPAEELLGQLESEEDQAAAPPPGATIVCSARPPHRTTFDPSPPAPSVSSRAERSLDEPEQLPEPPGEEGARGGGKHNAPRWSVGSIVLTSLVALIVLGALSGVVWLLL